VSTTTPPAPPPAPPPPIKQDRGGFGIPLWLSGGGFFTSLATTVLAFLMGGVVVAVTGSNPLSVYRGIFNGTGLNWFFPWVTGNDRENAAFNLQQTLLVTTTLIFVSMAVAFAFRCGLFNIGGQGQWTVGAIVSVWVGSSFADLLGPAHIVLAIVLAALAGAVWAGIAGILKATVGAHEVITTIMLNWIAYWIGSYLFGLGGPLQNDANASVPISNDVVDDAKLPVIWGDADLQGLHMGITLAIFALIAYWLILSRTTLGFRVRAVGRNAEAARYGGISVGRSYFLAMAIAGSFAGIGGAMDMLGWQFRLGQLDVQTNVIGFTGIAVAMLGRNTAVGVFFASLLFGALLYGTSTRSLDPEVFAPQLAGNLATMIQALVLLFIGADVLILYLWKRRGMPRFHLPRLAGRYPRPRAAVIGVPLQEAVARPARAPVLERLAGWAAARVPNRERGIAIAAMALGIVALLLAIPPFLIRQPVVPIVVAIVAAALAIYAVVLGERRPGYIALGIALVFGTLGVMATESSVSNLESVVVWSALTASMLRYATPLIFAATGGMFSERSGIVNIGLEGMLLIGAFFGILGADKFNSWIAGVLLAAVAGGLLAAIHAVLSIHLRADQILSGTAVWFLAIGLTGYLFIDVYGPEGTPGGIPAIPDLELGFLKDVPYFGDAFGSLNLMIWVGLALVPLSYYVIFRTPFGLRLRAAGEHPRAAETVGLSVYRIRYTAVIISGVLAGLGGAFLSIGFVNSFNERMTNGAGFIALAALILGNWRPKGIILACLLFGASYAVTQRLPVYSDSLAILFEVLPYVVTLIAVAGIVARPKPPASVGIPYVRS
jgi:simple sugar transport system permease protein